MIEFIKKYAVKYFTPLLACYGVFVLYLGYTYQRDISMVYDKDFFYYLYLGKVSVVGLIVGASLVFKFLRFPVVAALILAIPALLFAGFLLIVFGVTAFLAVLFILFGK